MIKKILPTMIGVALAGGMTAAAADVTVFGHIDEAIVKTDIQEDNVTSHDDTNLWCTTCSIGFKGSEDLGNGLKAIFKIDFQYDINERNRASDGNNSLFDRDQWVGLAGGFGKVTVGTQSTVYKSHGAMIDPIYRTVVQARDIGLQSRLHSGAGEEGHGRATNTFRWDSADFNGVKIGATYTLDSSEADGEDNNPYGIGASYENGGILVFADYITNDGDVTQADGDAEAWKLGGKFAMNNFSVFGQYEDGEADFGATTDEQTIWHIGGTYTMGSNTLYAAYGQYEDSSTGLADFDGDVFAIVGIHTLSKNTLVYGGYAQNEGDGADGGCTYFANIEWCGADVEASAFTVGMKHKF
jgi:predicted porin